jgi:hypothetical protein
MVSNHDNVACSPSLTVTVPPSTGFRFRALGAPASLEEHVPPQPSACPQYGLEQLGVQRGNGLQHQLSPQIPIHA